jgi:cob(I)alamin adenosyltransferase
MSRYMMWEFLIEGTMKKSLVYTKTGDKGQTGLIGGTRVAKNDVRLEAYGTVDELNSHIGAVWSFGIDASSKELLCEVQNQLFVIGAYLATDSNVSDLRSKLGVDAQTIEKLEIAMDFMESTLPPLANFVLPGGHPAVAATHIARTVCRRAERRVVEMMQLQDIDEWVVMYLNRLSDYLFVLSRHLTNYFQVEEIPWKPKL